MSLPDTAGIGTGRCAHAAGYLARPGAAGPRHDSAFLTTRAHWANGMDAALLERAIRHSLIIAAYHQGRQIGFARVITDYASFAYLSDVFVLPDWRGHGWARR
jgi:GNAT superfamily N-acetyltransferase